MKKSETTNIHYQATDSLQALKLNSIFEAFKPTDGEAAVKLLKEVKDFTQYQFSDRPLHFTDVGGGEGEMFRFFSPLAKKVLVNIIEPNNKFREQYRGRIEKTDNTVRGQILEKLMEEVNLPKSDVVLTSHSLYYSQRLWSQQSDVSYQNHLFTKFLHSLEDGGVWCVILQASEAPDEKYEKLANLEALEDVVYPFIEEARHRVSQSNRDRPTFANADTFKEALKRYEKLSAEAGEIIQWRESTPIVSYVHLGKVNFTPDKTGRYPQEEEVLKLLNFYTRDQYNNFKPEQQKELLEFIKHRCQRGGDYVVAHVNKAFVVMRQKNQQLEAEKYVKTGLNKGADSN